MINRSLFLCLSGVLILSGCFGTESMDPFVGSRNDAGVLDRRVDPCFQSAVRLPELVGDFVSDRVVGFVPALAGTGILHRVRQNVASANEDLILQHLDPSGWFTQSTLVRGLIRDPAAKILSARLPGSNGALLIFFTGGDPADPSVFMMAQASTGAFSNPSVFAPGRLEQLSQYGVWVAVQTSRLESGGNRSHSVTWVGYSEGGAPTFVSAPQIWNVAGETEVFGLGVFSLEGTTTGTSGSGVAAPVVPWLSVWSDGRSVWVDRLQRAMPISIMLPTLNWVRPSTVFGRPLNLASTFRVSQWFVMPYDAAASSGPTGVIIARQNVFQDYPLATMRAPVEGGAVRLLAQPSAGNGFYALFEPDRQEFSLGRLEPSSNVLVSLPRVIESLPRQVDAPRITRWIDFFRDNRTAQCDRAILMVEPEAGAVELIPLNWPTFFR